MEAKDRLGRRLVVHGRYWSYLGPASAVTVHREAGDNEEVADVIAAEHTFSEHDLACALREVIKEPPQ